jgi:hypothetical protein
MKNNIKIMYRSIEFNEQNVWLLSIIEQGQFGNSFGHNGTFKDSTGFLLYSREEPAISIVNDCLYVRGCHSKFDHNILVIKNMIYLKKIIMAIKEYNNIFNIPYIIHNNSNDVIIE